ncbi:hypothetical protein CRUP_034668 [Coryphaenoides rupestris]|nr:hypothetical protein CRUP_034668 [Coryphaenoides rupestris]
MVLGKVKSFSVTYDCLNDSNVPVFSSGDSVSGRVVVDVTGDMRVNPRNAGSNTAYTQNYTEEVEYLNHKDILIGHERDDDNSEEGLTTIHSGRHEPLATSFEGKHGSVRYWVKAELHRPWLLPMKTKKEFTVFEHIDINTPLLLSPQAGTKDKTLCCWFCTSGPISLSAKIERKGYTPGKMKEVKQLVANLRGESLSSGKTETWSGKMLKIPPVSPPSWTAASSASSVRGHPRSHHLSLNLPLVIGTNPPPPFGSRTSSVSSQCSMTMSWLGMALPERPGGYVPQLRPTRLDSGGGALVSGKLWKTKLSSPLSPPPYSSSKLCRDRDGRAAAEQSGRGLGSRGLDGPLFAYIHEFRFQPPPLKAPGKEGIQANV